MATTVFNPNYQMMENKNVLELFNTFQTLQYVGIDFANVITSELTTQSITGNEDANPKKAVAIGSKIIPQSRTRESVTKIIVGNEEENPKR